MVYSHSGSGQTLLLLHGFLEDRTMWNDVIKSLPGYSIIAVDLLGQGETGNVGYVHSMEAHAEAVAKVLKAENVSQCKVIGHSMGGYVALALAELKPQLLSGLVLLHSTASADSAEKQIDRERVIDLVKRNMRVYVQAVIPTLFAESNRDNHKKDILNLVKIACGFTQQGIIANIRGMMERKDQSTILKTGSFQKLLIHGVQDPVLNTEEIVAFGQLDASVEVICIESAGHMGHLETTKLVLSAISDFCKN